MNIIKHLPALQVLIPFFAALLCALSFNRCASWIIATISIGASFLLSIYGVPYAKDGISYAFGGWEAPIGIEYKLDFLNQPILVLINGILFMFLLFGRELINSTITNYIEKKRQNIFYTILLFAHAGYVGVISTNDLFNIYVFIEISSLSTYVLMSQGNNPRALVGAFDYLVLGTIGATLILIGIGFFLAITGSLNITDIANILNEGYNSKIIATAIVFFLSGAILKMAFFPMHFWMIRAYSSAPTYVLVYLASISSLIGVYIILRFLNFTVEGAAVQGILSMILRPAAMVTIAVCTLLALKTDTLKKVVIYSTASQIGYIFLLITIWSAYHVLFQLLVLDALNKVALFTIIAHIQNQNDDLRFSNFKAIRNSPLFKTLAAFAILFSSGLPLTSMFFVKITLYDLLIAYGLQLEFIVVLTGGVLGLLYHFRLIKSIFFSSEKKGSIEINSNLYGLVAIIIIQILSLIYITDIANFAGNTSILLGVPK